jgi:2-oxoglutarate dehydrogenase E2 component (dihydrolipoamide succinyltransferase)
MTMPVNLIVPQLGESIIEATVGRWRKSEGDFVSAGEVVLELETEKVNLEVGASHSGRLARIEKEEGANVKIGDVLAVIDEGAGPAAEAPTPQKIQAAPPAPAPEKAEPPPRPAPVAGKKAAGIADAPRATPTARRVAHEKGVDLHQVRPAATGAPITPADVVQHAQARQARTEPAPPPAGAPQGMRREERVRMSRRRLTIATRLVEALHSAAMVTTFNDIDMSAVMELRRRHKDSFKERYGVSLGIVSFFVKASIAALRVFPRLNAEIQGDEMVLKHYFDIGVAVGAPQGLVVPVLRHADCMSFAELEQAIKAFARKAEDGTLALEDLRGGTFTISNGGVFGSLLSTPILNPPQVGILGLHRIEDRPVNVEGEVRIRPMMYAALSYDHRIVDGLEAVRFLKHLKDLIESPEGLLLEN